MSAPLHDGSPSATPGTSDAMAEAIAWFLEFFRQTPSLDRWESFEVWLAQDPRNERYFIALERLWKNVQPSRDRARRVPVQKPSLTREEDSPGSWSSSLDVAYTVAVDATPDQPIGDISGYLTLGNTARSARRSVFVSEGGGPVHLQEALGSGAFFPTGGHVTPAVAQLLKTDPVVIRDAIDAASPITEPLQSAVLHLILGTALRLRASGLTGSERTAACAESLRAFETALGEFCERKVLQQQGESRIATDRTTVRANGTAAPQHGVQMVIDAAAAPVAQGNELLKEAIHVFVDAAELADRHEASREWVIARSNLACALTLLGQRTYGVEGAPMIERAVDILREAAMVCESDDLVEERAPVYVNLAEAFQGLAKCAAPGERIRYLESALDWLVAALKIFVPEDCRWLLELDRATFA